MTTSLANNQAARDAVLARTRRALGKSSDRAQARADAEAYVEAHRHGPRPTMPPISSRVSSTARGTCRAPSSGLPTPRAARCRRSLPVRGRCPRGVRRSGSARRRLLARIRRARLARGGPGDRSAARPPVRIASASRARSARSRKRARWSCCRRKVADGDGAACRIPTWPSFARSASYPAWRRRSRWCAASAGGLPRAVNLISGPSRTGDIEQTIVLGAHGPYQVHIVVSAEAYTQIAATMARSGTSAIDAQKR
jgi:hypothetical protein